MRFVTRERLHVDRIATAWLIRRFVDADATFAFVSREEDLSGRAETPFDVRGAELSHRGERCTFEVACEKHALTDRALRVMGRIVRGADLPHDETVVPEAAGVRALFDALRDGEHSDEERLELGSSVCDALYAYCRDRRTSP